MKLRSVACIAAFCASATATLADPCVTDTFDSPLDGATDVTAYVSDVPSAQFPAFWQEGTLEGYRYRMFASAEATLRPSIAGQDWVISITCNVSAQVCSFVNQGTPPADAAAVSNVIGQCLLGVEAEKNVPTAPPQVTAELDQTPVAEQSVQVPDPATCGSASVTEATDVATMQRLLVMAGEDPGPVDGFLGPKSFAAMEVFVQGANWGTPIPEVIAALDASLCDTPN